MVIAENFFVLQQTEQLERTLGREKKKKKNTSFYCVNEGRLENSRNREKIKEEKNDFTSGSLL